MTKRIGIVGWAVSENGFGAGKSYLSWLSQFGEVEILLPSNGMKEGLDLLILPGGADVAPQSYGAVPGFYTGNTDVYKQHFYNVNLPQYIAAGVPVFGICLGFQQLCALHGGKLLQHEPYDYSGHDRTKLVDTLTFGTKQYYKETVPYKVNSLHHQGCDHLPATCEVIARSQAGNIEVAQFAHNIFGVQYHPEEINDVLAGQIIYQLLY